MHKIKNKVLPLRLINKKIIYKRIQNIIINSHYYNFQRL